ncbi:uncharacterized protein [Rutidosis leptorrhynchoides]|uniref:uncharacterized protein n=1 Tax=Rutidosis leptorrhynchoides TaxID=125765 RepID=UPI003A9A1791
MAERRVLNKCYSLDIDPAAMIERRRNSNKGQLMLPMSIQCSTCRNYMNKGTRFKSRKEDVIGETYRGIQIRRFYFNCTMCSAEIIIKTDPQNVDYTVESGGVINFELWLKGFDELELID